MKIGNKLDLIDDLKTLIKENGADLTSASALNELYDEVVKDLLKRIVELEKGRPELKDLLLLQLSNIERAPEQLLKARSINILKLPFEVQDLITSQLVITGDLIDFSMAMITRLTTLDLNAKGDD